MKQLLIACGFDISETFGLVRKTDIRLMDKEFKCSNDYNLSRKVFPNVITKAVFSLQSPDDSKAVGFICKKVSKPDGKMVKLINWKESDAKNKDKGNG